jgi:hypothetical protein
MMVRTVNMNLFPSLPMHRDLRKEHGKHRARYSNDFVAGLLLTSRAVFRFDAQRTTVQRAAGRDPHVERESRPPYTTPVIEEPSRRAWSRAARCAAAWRLAASGSVQRRARKPSPNCLAHCFSRRKPAVGATIVVQRRSRRAVHPRPTMAPSDDRQTRDDGTVDVVSPMQTENQTTGAFSANPCHERGP